MDIFTRAQHLAENCHMLNTRLWIPIFPDDQKLTEHGDWATARQLAKSTVQAELLVSHAHVLLICLCRHSLSDGFQLCGGSSLIDLQQ